MLVDAENDQDEFRADARKDHTYNDAGNRGQQHYESVERTDGHRRKRRQDSGNPEQRDHRHDKPVERLDDRGRDETVPLKQVLKVEHRWFSGGSSNLVPSDIRLTPKFASGKSRSSATGGARPRRDSYADGRVEIAANK